MSKKRKKQQMQENPIKNLLVCAVGALVLLNLLSFGMSVLVWHQPFTFRVVHNLILPLAIGVALFFSERNNRS